MHRAAHVAGLAFFIERVGFGECLWIEFDHRVERRARLVDRRDALQVRLRQRVAGQIALRHALLERDDADFVEGEGGHGGRSGALGFRGLRCGGLFGRIAGLAARGREQGEGKQGKAHGKVPGGGVPRTRSIARRTWGRNSWAGARPETSEDLLSGSQ